MVHLSMRGSLLFARALTTTMVRTARFQQARARISHVLSTTHLVGQASIPYTSMFCFILPKSLCESLAYSGSRCFHWQVPTIVGFLGAFPEARSNLHSSIARYCNPKSQTVVSDIGVFFSALFTISDFVATGASLDGFFGNKFARLASCAAFIAVAQHQNAPCDIVGFTSVAVFGAISYLPRRPCWALQVSHGERVGCGLLGVMCGASFRLDDRCCSSSFFPEHAHPGTFTG